MGLSVVIAVMGLSEDSPALVIGAMLVAPLMTPVLGLAAALAAASGRRIGTSAGLVFVASLGCVGLAWAISRVLPQAGPGLTHEVLSRTSPDLRDLAVAVAAGGAGAFATVRKDVSAALPGVAVAVALVPPLAVIGMSLGADRVDLAYGALLLYLANLSGITLAGVIVILATGLTSTRHRGRLVATIALVTAGTVAVGVPLQGRSMELVARAKIARAVNSEVLSWLGSKTDLKLLDVRIVGARVAIDVVGAHTPPPAQSLATALARDLGAGVAVDVRWFARGGSNPVSTDQTVAPAPTASDTARKLADDWAGRHLGLTVTRVDLQEHELTVDIAGASPPSTTADLETAIHRALGSSLKVVVRFSTLRILSSPSSQ